MKNTMKKAHEIRRAAAAKWNCKTSEIVFSMCLEMAWADDEGEMEMDRKEIAEEIAAKTGSRVWTTTKDGEIDKVRVYFRKGFAIVNEDGVNIDNVGGHSFDDAKDACKSIGVESYRR